MTPTGPGWYEDPYGESDYRWWTGERWHLGLMATRESLRRGNLLPGPQTAETARRVMREPAPPPVAKALSPGWYRDPQRPRRERWWDGRGWTAYGRRLGAGDRVARRPSRPVGGGAVLYWVFIAPIQFTFYSLVLLLRLILRIF